MATTSNSNQIPQNDNFIMDTLVKNIRESGIQAAIDAVLIACDIDRWYIGEISNERLLKTLEEAKGKTVWVAIAEIGKFDPTYTHRLLVAAVRERMEDNAA